MKSIPLACGTVCGAVGLRYGRGSRRGSVVRTDERMDTRAWRRESMLTVCISVCARVSLCALHALCVRVCVPLRPIARIPVVSLSLSSPSLSPPPLHPSRGAPPMPGSLLSRGGGVIGRGPKVETCADYSVLVNTRARAQAAVTQGMSSMETPHPHPLHGGMGGDIPVPLCIPVYTPTVHKG